MQHGFQADHNAEDVQTPPLSAGTTAGKFQLSFNDIRRYFETKLGTSLPAKDEVKARCPFHDDRTPSMSINLKDGTWYCHTCGEGSGILEFEKRLTHTDTDTAWSEIYRVIGRAEPEASPKNRKLVATYPYPDEEGKLLYEKLKFEPKSFVLRQPDGRNWKYTLNGCRKVLYNLPEVITAKYVAIVEGEKDADNLRDALIAANIKDFGVTTNFDGAGKWKPEYSTYFTGRFVVVLRDNDEKGRLHQQTVCASVKPFAAKVKAIDLPGVGEKEDISDWLGAGHTVKEFLALIETTPIWAPPTAEPGAYENADGWPDPEPLGAELPPVPAFDPGLLPASLRPMVEDVAKRMQVPLDFPAVASVATLAGLCGRRAIIQPKEHDSTWTVTPNLWGAIVGSPGVLKSPTIACITAPARAIEAQWRAEYESELGEAETSKLLADLRASAWKQRYVQATKKGEEPPIQLDDSVPQPHQKRAITTDATYESLHKIMADNPGGVFVLCDELTGWLAGLERQGREQERAFYLTAWNGDEAHTLDRIERGSIHCRHCCASLFGGLQPARLRAYFADALKDGPTNDGLIQRFQLLVWPDTKADWIYMDRPPDADAMTKAEGVYRRISEMDVDVPLRLKFTTDAQALFVEWFTDLETRLRAEDMSVFMQAHLSKYRSLMPSLALLFSIADGELNAVGLQHAKQAADFCVYLEQHAKRVYASRISPERLAAIALSQKLAKGWKRESGVFSVRDVYQNDWSGLATPDEVRAALRLLEDAAWVRPEKPKSEAGRPSEIYAINPKIGGDRADH